jgi:hypothetical protein
MPYRLFISGAIIYNTSIYLFGNNYIKVLFKYSSELVIIGFLGYRYTRVRNKVGTLSGYNVEAVL